MSTPKIAFELEKNILPLEVLLPVRQVSQKEQTATRFKAIVQSVKNSGLVEPIMVYPKKGAPGFFFITDGHLRYWALKELGITTADCIVATDDESYICNAKVNRLAPIQEHKMIMKAVQNGVPAERIASALGLKIEYVRSSINLLDGIHEEVANLLKDKQVSPKTISVLKRVSTVRQIEIAELMVSTNNFHAWYAEALFIGTPKSELRRPTVQKARIGLSAEDIARMENEMESIAQDFKKLQTSYGEDMLSLTLIAGYIRRILKNPRVIRHLKSKYPDFLPEFESIAATDTL
ncbi:MAG: plasmid partitioning protein RepB C-terminal domain-containing protein [Verrucomicrobiota bacterium]